MSISPTVEMSISPTAKMAERDKKGETCNINDDGLKPDNYDAQNELCISRIESGDVNCKSEILEDEVVKFISHEEKLEGEVVRDNLHSENEMDKMQSIPSKTLDGASYDDIDQNEIVSEGETMEFKVPKLESDKKYEHQGTGDKANMSIELVSETQDLKLDSLDECSDLGKTVKESRNFDLEGRPETYQESFHGKEKERDPVFEGLEVTGIETSRSNHSLDPDMEAQKAAALKNFVNMKGVAVVSTFLRRLSGKRDEFEKDINENKGKEALGSDKDMESKETFHKNFEKSIWNPLSYIKVSRDVDEVYKNEEVSKESATQIVMRGRVLLYTRLGCPECKEARLFFHHKRLRYVEINIDIYPSRKLELDKISGSSSVPKVFFNEILIGGLNELKNLEASGKLNEKIEYLIAEVPSREAPLPPLSGEDDVSNSGTVDELALIVCKMKESIVVKDRFYKMRKFSQCFIGSEAVNFLSEDQYLEREEAVEFGRKLASKLFFQNVLEENLFEDGNHLYRFLDDDLIISSQCYNIPRGIIDVKPKPLTDIASRLRFLSFAIFESYVSENGKHVDYRSIHGSEEFSRYLRIAEELQRVEVPNMSREEKLAFFINLYNMMAIHAILVCGHPTGALDRRKLFGEFKYVVGGSPYSLSDIQNGILRGNQRPPYNLMKPFGAKDKRSKVALPYVEPLMHFALVGGTRSGPAIQCYSPGNIDKELVEAARNFLRSGGLLVDLKAKVASVNQILKWFSMDFGKNETEVMKHASNYLEAEESQALLEMIANSELKVTYQPYDWDLNC